MKLFISRRGQTLFNYLERVQGWCDSPLTDLGVKQSKQLGNHLAEVKLDAVFSSDLARAVKTAEFIAERQKSKVNVQSTFLLREAYYGGFEGGSEEGPWTPVFKKYGYPASAIKTDFENALQKLLKEASNEEVRNIIAKNDPLNLAENYNSYYNRVYSFVEAVKIQKCFKNIAIVSHGGTAQLILEMLLDNTDQITEVDNCSVSIVDFKNDEANLIQFNDISYLT